MKKYIDRLVKEWQTHGKIIVGVDFDNTISPYHTLDNQEDIDRTIKILKDCQLVGCYTVIHTACNEDRHSEIMEYCNKIGIKVDSINQTPIELPYGNKGSKPYCNHFLDDRAALPAALDILEEAMYKQRSFKYSSVNRDEIG
jgi:predicted HAD superfamily phosphohydrolase YqeG